MRKKETRIAETIKWGNNMIRLLLHSYFMDVDNFRNTNTKKNHLWVKISKKIKEYGYSVMPDMCDKKFQNLKGKHETTALVIRPGTNTEPVQPVPSEIEEGTTETQTEPPEPQAVAEAGDAAIPATILMEGEGGIRAAAAGRRRKNEDLQHF
ncbi:hypothetical protein Trydic_g18312 [Trypoxylus dichotomus]